MGRKITERKYIGPQELPKDYIGRYNHFCKGDEEGLMEDDGR